MSRVHLTIERGGFPVYQSDQIGKVNALRRAHSLPDVETPIIATKGQALFTTAEEMHNEPASCYNCQSYNSAAKTCSIIGSRVPIQKFTVDGIEYWPHCAAFLYGTPKTETSYSASRDPDYLALKWINAPKPGQELGGANCGGCDGGDDCDNYIVQGAVEKWKSPTGRCRALRTPVACGDECALWWDDDILEWRQAVKILGEQNGKVSDSR
jgi:hypothetical protein